MILDMIHCRLPIANFRFVRVLPKRNGQSAIGDRKWLAGFSQSNWLFDEVISAGAANFFNVASFDWKEAAEIGPVLINAAGAGTVGMLLEKGTLEYQLATGATAITVTTAECKRGYDLLPAKTDINKTAQLPLCLPGAKFCVLDCARAQPLFQARFERTLPQFKRVTGGAHWLCWKVVCLMSKC
jgi:hypothetical protein